MTMTPYISGLYRHPLKSGKPESLNAMPLTPHGPAGDRMLMLVDVNGDLISQRPGVGIPKLALVGADINHPEEVRFQLPNNEQFVLPKQKIEDSNILTTVKVHDSECHGYDLGDEAAAWFEKYLGKECRLVSYAEDYPRMVDPEYAQSGDKVGFADGMQLLFASTSSLDALKQQSLSAAFGMERFRPNVVIDGMPAWQEDIIAKVSIGGAIFEFVKPCTRCPMVTIDQFTGEKAMENNPFQLLGEHRKGNADGLSGRFFGQNAAFRDGAPLLKVGQRVEILEAKPMHPAVQQAALKYEAA